MVHKLVTTSTQDRLELLKKSWIIPLNQNLGRTHTGQSVHMHVHEHKHRVLTSL